MCQERVKTLPFRDVRAYNGGMNSTVSVPGRIAGALLPILIAALLVPARERLDGATLVLILVVVVVSVATTGDRVAAAIAAIVAAASFDFFLTRPFGSLRITAAADIETTVMLLAIGLIVGQVAIAGRRRRGDADRARDELRRLELVADRIATEPVVQHLVEMVAGQVAELCDLERCDFSLARPDGSELRPEGTMPDGPHRLVDGEFALPPDGVAVRVADRGATLGWLHLVPGAHNGLPLETRQVVVALANQLGAALARRPAPENDGATG